MDDTLARLSLSLLYSNTYQEELTIGTWISGHGIVIPHRCTVLNVFVSILLFFICMCTCLRKCIFQRIYVQSGRTQTHTVMELQRSARTEATHQSSSFSSSTSGRIGRYWTIQRSPGFRSTLRPLQTVRDMRGGGGNQTYARTCSCRTQSASWWFL